MKEIIEEVFNQVMDEACTNPLHRFSELLLERVQKTDIFIHEVERLKDLNQRLVATAKELGYADDTHEWDDAWSKMCKLMKEVG